MNYKKISLLKDEDLQWGFDSANPTYYLPTQFAGWNRDEKVDPFPCYSHDLSLVQELSHEIFEKFPMKNPVSIFVLSHECPARTNGWHTKYGIYEKEQQNGETDFNWESMIALHGKRIPIMKTMTEYLVSHEISHAVECFIAEKFKMQENRETFLKYYCELRGIEYTTNYGGRRWHKHPGEIFANDARILLFNKALDFWPHDVEYPTKSIKLIEWWESVKEYVK